MANDNEIILTVARSTRVVVTALTAIMLTATARAELHRSSSAKSTVASVAQAAASTPSAVVDTFHAALARGDTRAALDFLAEDVLIFESGGVEHGRSEYADHHLGADAAFSAAVRRTRVSRSHGEAGDAAWVTSVEAVSGNYRGRAINSRLVETMLLRKEAGQWRIFHIHWSSINVAPNGDVGTK